MLCGILFVMTRIPYYQTPNSHIELGPNFSEAEEHDAFNDLLSGMDELTSAEGGVSASDFIQRTFEEMEKQGIEFNELRIAAVIKIALGTRTQAVERLIDLTEEEFHSKYPESVGKAILWYIAPLFEDRLP